MAVGIIKNKYLAVTIGPEGYGIYGLLNTFFTMLSVFAGGWLAPAVIKYISEFQNEKNKVEYIYSLVTRITVISSLIIVITSFIFTEIIIDTFMGPEVKRVYFLIFSVSFIGSSLRPIYQNILQGLQKAASIFKVRAISSILDIILTITLVYFFGLLGLFLSILSISILFIIIYSYFINENIPLKYNPTRHAEIGNKIFIFSGVNFFLTFFNLGIEYLQRLIILNYVDMVSVGLMTAGMAIIRYMSIINRGSGFYFFPEMSKLMTQKSRENSINQMVFFNSISYSFMAIILLLFQKPIIILMYSKEFDGLISIMPLLIIGIYIRSIGGIFNTVILGMNKLFGHAVISIMSLATYLLITLLFIAKYELLAIGYSYLLSSLIAFLISYYYLRRNMVNYNPLKLSHLLLFLNSAIIPVLFRSMNVMANIVFAMLLIGSVLLIIKYFERAYYRIIINEIKSYLVKIM